MGKTTFVQKLGEAMGRPTAPISCAGLEDVDQYSTSLDDSSKPNIVS